MHSLNFHVSYMYLSLNLLQCTMCTFLHAIYSMYAFPFAVVFEHLYLYLNN